MPGLRPFVVVGTGGSGGKTVRLIREVLRQKLVSLDWHGEWPDAWQLLHIDVPVIPDGVTDKLPYELPASDYLNLAQRNGSYMNVDTTVDSPGGDTVLRHMGIECWRPYEPEHVNRKVSITMGAGQYRAVGRMALLSRLSDVSKRVNRAIDDARAADGAILLELQRRMGNDGGALGTTHPFVIVTGSLAGGSGSGTLLDVCDIIRASSGVTGVSEIISVLYTPEMFQAPDGTYDPGVAPNTFMAINELQNSMVTAGLRELPVGRSFVFGRGGLTPSPHAGLGPSAAVLVGRQNTSISLGAAFEVYQVMGSALANVLTDPGLQDEFIAYGLGNAAAKTQGKLNNNPLFSDTTRHTGDVFMAMGFSRVSVGLEFVNRYAAERLARMALERLLDHHLTLATRDQRRNDDELLAMLVDQAWPRFLQDSRCSEAGVGQDGRPNSAIVDALWPAAAGGLLTGWAQSALTETLRSMGGGSQEPEEVRATLSGNLARSRQASGETVANQILTEMHKTTRDWVASVHDSMRTLATRSMVDYGLPAAAALFRRLAAHLETARAELASEANLLGAQVNSGMASFLTRSVTDPAHVKPTPDAVQPFVTEAQRWIKGHCRKLELEFAAVVAGEIRTGLVLPWAQAISDADGLLRLEARPPHGNSVATFWPGRSGVPESLRPSRCEFLLEDVDQFPAIFDRLVQDNIGGSKPLAEAMYDATRSVAEGEPVAQFPDLPTLVGYRQRWHPDIPEIIDDAVLPGPALINVSLDLELLFRRAVAWLKDDQKPSGRYLRLSLESYLSDPQVSPATRRLRSDKLLAEFRAALQTSAPLASIDAGMLSAVYGEQSAASHLTMSSLNIPSGDQELRQRLTDVAVQQGLQATDITFTNSPRSDAQIFQFTERGYQPMVFSSVMGPLTSQWARARIDGGLRVDFWRWRRTRALSETVPVDHATRVRLLRGWYVGRLLGLARVSESEERSVIQVFDGSDWLEMPNLGPRRISPENAPGNVLELIPIGVMDAYVSKSPDALRPWGTLNEFGSEDAPKLRAWLRGERTVKAAGRPLLNDSQVAPLERGRLLLVELGRLRETVVEDAKRNVGAADLARVQSNLVSEIISEITEAIDSLTDDIENLVANLERADVGGTR